MTDSEILDHLFQRMEALGGNMAQCAAAVWIKGVMAQNPKTTILELIDMIDAKIDAGEADHGWIIPGLNLVWDEMSEEQRLRDFEVLKKGGALMPIVRDRVGKKALTGREKAFLADYLTETRADAHLEKLNRG